MEIINPESIERLISEALQQKFSGWDFSYIANRCIKSPMLVFYLKVISWQIADFSVEKYYEKLAEIHNAIQREGSLKIKSHRLLVVAQKI